MYEQMRNDFLAAFPDAQTVELSEVLRVLDKIASGYDIRKQNIDIMPEANELPDVAKNYLVCKKMAGLTDQTLENYRLILSIFFSDVQKPVEAITANDIRLFLFSYQDRKGISTRTLDKYRAYIAGFFAWAQDEGYIEKNPAKNINAIKYEEKPRDALTQYELEYLRMACNTKREIAIIEVLYSTGCRVSELSVLKKSDINWGDKSVHLFGKGRKHRVSFLNAKAEISLRNYLNERTDESEYLFVSERKPHGRIGKDAIEKIVRNIVKRMPVGLDKHITPHTLRHTTATVALKSGMPITDISRLLGHESIETTMIYAKTSVEDIRIGHGKYVV